jgi:N-methylhydantoinase B
MVELHHPIRVYSRSLVPDTEGAGMHRGAPSLRVAFGSVKTVVSVAYVSDGVLNPAQGVHGGHAGGTATQFLQTASQTQDLPNVGQISINPGEILISTGTGGGGFGKPHRRDPLLVQRDVIDRLVSRERAENIYGVQLTSTDEIDWPATARLREGKP